MSKILDWDSLSTPFGSRPVPGMAAKPKVTGQDLRAQMKKAMDNDQNSAERMQEIQKAEPAMKAVFKYRLVNRVPITITRPMQYRTSELVKGANGASFQDRIAYVQPGTVLTPVSIDPTMEEYIFKGSDGVEHAIPFCDERAIFMSTDIYELVMNHIRGE